MLDPTPQEFPRIDERRFGLEYRYAYSVPVPPDGNPQLEGAAAIYKHDLETGERLVHDFGAGRLPGEFIFVPASTESTEDGEWLIGLVISGSADTTDLVILDA